MAHILFDGTHQIDDGTPVGDIVTTLKSLMEAGRGNELVEFNGSIRDGIPMNGPIHRVYPILLQFAHDGVRKSIAEVAEKIEKAKWAVSAENRALVAHDPIKPADEAQIQAWLAKAGAQAVGLRRELAPSGEFAVELEQLDDQIALITSLMQEPLDQRESGAGKVRVLDEWRNRLNDQIAAGSNDIDPGDFHNVNEESKRLIRELTGQPVLKAVEQILEEAFPGMIRAFYPRVYEFAGRYHSPRIMAVMMANVVAEMLRYGYHKSATAYRLMMPGLAYLKERRMPMFFLAPDLLEAVLRTDFDDDINWQGMELPYESGLLMLPKGSLVHPVDGEIAMLMWSRVRQGDQPSPWPGIPMSVLPNDSFVLLGACPDTMIWYDSILTANVRPTMRLNNLFYRAPGEPVPHVERSNFMDADLTDLDAGFVEKMGVILFGTFLAMNARPQLVEHGKLLKRVGKTVEQAREFWSPNVIGAKYKFRREVPHIVRGKFEHSTREGGTHASPRLHWRRGHYRNQPVGPGRKERKTIWLEPCLIGAE